MSSQVFSAPVPVKRPKREYRISPSPKKRKTMTDFNTFCTWVLDYEASLKEESEHVKKRSPSPLDSEGNSTSSSDASDVIIYSPTSHKNKMKDDEWTLITCYCCKPFAGRPMIECSECATWIHLSCAKIRKTNVPEIFICQRCRDSKYEIRRSNRAREPKKQFKELYEDL